MSLPSRLSIWIGFDPREAAAFAVARSSARRWTTTPIPVIGLVLSDLQRERLYTRPIEWRNGTHKPVMWDTVSNAPMATEFACSRFLVPHLAQSGLALFMDCDFLVRHNLSQLFATLDRSKAVHVVKHDYRPAHERKMDGQIQTSYNRKLWSAFCIYDCDHPANQRLTLEYINNTPGRELHAFGWLDDSEIGELDEAWHWIPGHSSPAIAPRCIHFTEGGPWFPGFEDQSFADEWREAYAAWAR